MTPLLLAALLQASPPAPAAPRDASGWVLDEANVLSEATESRLNGVLAAHHKGTSNQVVVLTVASLGGDAVESVALRRASELKIGRDDVDNGVLLLVAPNERKVRIEVGYGLEGPLPDARCAQIIRSEILPRFRAGDLDGGVEQGARAILAAIEGTYSPAPSAGRGAHEPAAGLGFEGQFMLGLVAGLVLAPLARRLSIDAGSLRWLRGGIALVPGLALGIYFPVALLGFALATLMSLRRDVGPRGGGGGGYTYSPSGGAWSGGGWSSSSSGSDSFSGGGGDFGGGGASGSW